MSYGVIANGILDIPIIDNYYAGYALLEKININFFARVDASGYVASLPINNYPQSAIFAFNPPVGKLVSYWGDKLFSDTSTAIEGAVFLPHNEIGKSSESYGLRVYNEHGKLVFDSGNIALNTLKIHNIPDVLYSDYWVYDAYYLNGCTPGSWIMPTTWGVVRFVAHSRLSVGMGFGLIRQSDGNFAIGLLGMGLAPGSLLGTVVDAPVELIEVTFV